MTDDPSIRVAAENRGDAGGADRERCHRRCAGRIHNNVRKKIARGYQNGHERCVRRRNLRYSRRPVQYLQRLRHHAGGVPSNIVDHPHRLETISHLLCCIWCYITSKISLNWIIASREKKKRKELFSLNYNISRPWKFSRSKDTKVHRRYSAHTLWPFTWNNTKNS